MGMADEVNDRLSAAQNERQTREAQWRRNLAEFSTLMDGLTREFVDSASRLRLKPTDKGSWGLRGWFLFAFTGTNPSGNENGGQLLHVLIKTDGTWTWADRIGYRVKADRPPSYGLTAPPDRETLRQKLVEKLEELARLMT